MAVRQRLTEWSRGDCLAGFWRLYRLHARAKNRLVSDVLGFLMARSARRHGGYVGRGAVVEGEPSLPHGLHGIYISRYARIGRDCRIYQNVTIGEVGGRAPRIGRRCLIGAGAVLVGGITVGDGAKIGAGAVVSRDVPPGCTVVAQPPRVLCGGQRDV